MDDKFVNEYSGLDPHDLDLLTRFHPLNKFPSYENAMSSESFVEEVKTKQPCEDFINSDNSSKVNEFMVEREVVASGGGSSKKTSKGRGQKPRVQEDEDFIARQIRECIGSGHKGSGAFSGENSSKNNANVSSGTDDIDRPNKEKSVSLEMAGVAHAQTNVGRKVARGRGRGKMKIEIL